MQSRRPAIVLAFGFIFVGVLYYILNHTVKLDADPAGATMLVFAGIAMGFGFYVLLRGSREL